MAVLKREEFVFTWEIENFSMYPAQEEGFLYSPEFVVDFIEEIEWRLLILPSSGDNIPCLLQKRESDNAERPVSISFMFSVHSEFAGKDLKSKVLTKIFIINDAFGHDDFISRGDVFKPDTGLLPNDILTIKCHVWIPKLIDLLLRLQISKTDGKQDIPDPASTLSSCSKDCLKTSQCSVRTLINTRSVITLHEIKKFSALQQDINCRETVVFCIQNSLLFQIALHLIVGSECVCLEIYRDKECKSYELFVRGKIKTLGSPKTSQHQVKSEHYFSSNDKDNVWRFPTFLKWKDLRDNKYLCYTDDVLYLHCEFYYSLPADEYTFEGDNFKCPIYQSNGRNCLSCSSKDYERLYRSGNFSDVTLRVGDRNFKVHKNILSTKSDVFNAMFNSDMREKASGVVDITDIEPHVMDRFLTFVYTDFLGDLNHKEAASLYEVADKYNVVSLKCRCCCVLISTLSVSNVCLDLNLAKRHQDEDLMNASLGFLYMNRNAVFHSANWKNFTVLDSQLAAEIMLRILLSN